MIYSAIYTALTFSETLNEIRGEGLTAKGVLFLVSLAVGIELLFLLANYFFRGFAIYKMSSRMKMKKLFLAFIPCGCFYLLGRLQDDSIPNNRNKLYTYLAIVFSALDLFMSVVTDFLLSYSALNKIIGALGTQELMTSAYVGFVGTFGFTNGWLLVLNIFSMIFGFAYAISSILIYMNVYRAYAPERAVAYSAISILADFFFETGLLYNIFLFSMRNKDRKNFMEFVRAKRDGYARNYGPYGPYGRGGYGNPYNNGNRQDPYNNGNFYKGNDQNSGDPFEEFSQKNDEPFSDFDPKGGNADKGSSGESDRSDDDLFV